MKRRLPHLRTAARRAIAAAVRAQTGYPRVSRIRLRSLVIRCIGCGEPCLSSVGAGERHDGFWICSAEPPYHRGALWFWERRLDYRRWRRRVVAELREMRNERLVRDRVPNRAARRAVIFGLAAIFQFARGGAS